MYIVSIAHCVQKKLSQTLPLHLAILLLIVFLSIIPPFLCRAASNRQSNRQYRIGNRNQTIFIIWILIIPVLIICIIVVGIGC